MLAHIHNVTLSTLKLSNFYPKKCSQSRLLFLRFSGIYPEVLLKAVHWAYNEILTSLQKTFSRFSFGKKSKNLEISPNNAPVMLNLEITENPYKWSSMHFHEVRVIYKAISPHLLLELPSVSIIDFSKCLFRNSLWLSRDDFINEIYRSVRFFNCPAKLLQIELNFPGL